MTPYTRTGLIPFHTCDPAGILFFGNVFVLAHETLELFVVGHLGMEWDDWFNHPTRIIPIVQTSAHYHKPLLAGHSYKIETSVVKMGTSSIHFRYLFLQETTTHCAVETVHVFCDRQSKKKIPIPEEIRQLCLGKR